MANKYPTAAEGRKRINDCIELELLPDILDNTRTAWRVLAYGLPGDPWVIFNFRVRDKACRGIDYWIAYDACDFVDHYSAIPLEEFLGVCDLPLFDTMRQRYQGTVMELESRK